jgi:Putative prokaryotic signal transducing protein
MAAKPTPDPNEKLVRVFETEQESEAMVVSGLLESQGVDCDVAAIDLAQDVFPVGGVMILVREEDAERARQIIEEYRRTPTEESEEENASGAGEEDVNETP